MKYTTNIVNKLLLIGFTKLSEYKDPEIEYEVFVNGPVEATICFTNKTISFTLLTEDEIHINSLSELSKLIAILKSCIDSNIIKEENRIK